MEAQLTFNFMSDRRYLSIFEWESQQDMQLSARDMEIGHKIAMETIADELVQNFIDLTAYKDYIKE